MKQKDGILVDAVLFVHTLNIEEGLLPLLNETVFPRASLRFLQLLLGITSREIPP